MKRFGFRTVPTCVFLFHALALAGADSTRATSGDAQPRSTVPAADVAPSGSKVWIGRYAEYEEFLRSATIERAVPMRFAQHVFFKPGGLASSGSLRTEAYNLEIAGYRLDRALSLDMVPPTVEVRSKGQPASLQLWVDDVKLVSEIRAAKVSPPDPTKWKAQIQRAYVFENLVANLDPNEGTPVVDSHWNLMILDHSMGFTTTLVQPYEIGKTLNQIDRAFFNRMVTLNRAAVTQAIGDMVTAAAIDALLARRDALVKAFEKLAAERGASHVFTR